MKRVCSYCRKIYGEKESSNSNEETHGACDECVNLGLIKISLIISKSKWLAKQLNKGVHEDSSHT